MLVSCARAYDKQSINDKNTSTTTIQKTPAKTKSYWQPCSEWYGDCSEHPAGVSIPMMIAVASRTWNSDHIIIDADLLLAKSRWHKWYCTVWRDLPRSSLEWSIGVCRWSKISIDFLLQMIDWDAKWAIQALQALVITRRDAMHSSIRRLTQSKARCICIVCGWVSEKTHFCILSSWVRSSMRVIGGCSSLHVRFCIHTEHFWLSIRGVNGLRSIAVFGAIKLFRTAKHFVVLELLPDRVGRFQADLWLCWDLSSTRKSYSDDQNEWLHLKDNLTQEVRWCRDFKQLSGLLIGLNTSRKCSIFKIKPFLRKHLFKSLSHPGVDSTRNSE